MSSFTERLSTTQVEVKPLLVRLEKDFIYYVGEEGSDKSVTVKRGFECDGGSIPRFAWSLVGSPMGQGAQAFFLHDALYASEILDRAEADRIMEEALLVLGYGWFRRKTIYRAVRMFGGFVWKKHTPQSTELARNYIEVSGYGSPQT